MSLYFTSKEVVWLSNSPCIIGVMEADQRSTGDSLAKPMFDPDLVPMYALTEQEYQMIINNLANLVVAAIKQMQHEGHSHLAWLVADHAYEILRGYDDDVAEYV